MASEELVNYIKQVRTQGFKDSDIKEHLLANGYSDEIVTEAFKQIAPPIVPPVPGQPKLQERKAVKKRKIPIWVHILVLCVLIVLILKLQMPSISAGCDDIKLDVHELNGEKIICSFPDNSKIQMIIKNSGESNINFVNVKVIGTDTGILNKDFEETIENLNLLPEDVSTNVVDYGIGEISAVELTPGVVEEGKKYVCRDKMISFSSIKSC